MNPTPTRIVSVKEDDLITPAGLAAPEGAVAGVVRKNHVPERKTSATFTRLKVAWFSSAQPDKSSLIQVKTHHVNVTTGYLFVMCNLNDRRSKQMYDRLFQSINIVDLNGGDDDDGDDEED